MKIRSGVVLLACSVLLLGCGLKWDPERPKFDVAVEGVQGPNGKWVIGSMQFDDVDARADEGLVFIKLGDGSRFTIGASRCIIMPSTTWVAKPQPQAAQASQRASDGPAQTTPTPEQLAENERPEGLEKP